MCLTGRFTVFLCPKVSTCEFLKRHLLAQNVPYRNQINLAL